MSDLSPPPNPLRLGILASGRGTNLHAIIDAIEGGQLSAQIAVVLSDQKDAQAITRAKQHKVPAVFIDPKRYDSREAYDDALLETLKSHGVELVILAGFMRLLTPHLVVAYHGRVINIHPSLLPAFPGLQAQGQALSHGVKVSGCTIHFVDEQMDHGPIIAQATVPVLQGDTEAILSNRILVEEHRLIVEVIQCYSEGRLTIEGRKVHIDQQSYTEAIK